MDTDGFDILIRRAQQGDREALEELLVTIRPYLTRVASGYADSSRASASTSDLIQEAELRAWQKLAQFQGGSADVETHAKFRTWLVQIVRHIAFDRNRARQTRKRKAPGGPIRSLDASTSPSTAESSAVRLDPPARGPTPSAGLREMERLSLVREALDKIRDETDREILRLFFFEARSLPHIAEEFHWTHDRVREHYRRGIRQLEHHLRTLRPE